MKYFPSDYLNAIASREPRLQAIDRLDDGSPDEPLLIEESQLVRLGQVDFFIDIIVLTENPEPILISNPHVRVVKSIHRYTPFSKLRTLLFSDRYPITLFTSTMADEAVASFCQELATQPTVLDFRLTTQRTASLLSDAPLTGYHRLTDSLSDVLDPPLEQVEALILRQARDGTVGLISLPLKGSLDQLLLTLADEIVVFLRREDRALWDKICPNNKHCITVCTGHTKDAICWEPGSDRSDARRRIHAARLVL